MSGVVLGTALVGVVFALIALWAVFMVVLAVRRPDSGTLKESLRLLPDVVRLVRRLAAEPTLGRAVRLRLWLLLGYLLLPVDLVPDFIPVLGYADDAIVVALALRAVVRRAGPEPVRRHWPGTPDGLAVIARLCRLPELVG